MNPYETLGIKKTATTEQIKAAYKSLAKKHHPDAEGDPERFHEINFAHQILTDPERRGTYDETGRIDQKAVNDIRHGAVNLLATYFNNIISNGVLFDRDLDPLKFIVTAAKQDKEVTAINKAEGEERLAALEKVLNRISRKDDTEPNVFKDMIESHIDGIRRQIAKIERQAETINMVLEELENYESVEEAVRTFYTVRLFNTGGRTPGDPSGH